ncbi:MAG: cell division protein FtsA [Nitrospirae bacterium]|nr:cell division protein FtsA [Nitrospirota bacterium]
MSNKKDEIVVGLDLGTTKVCTVVAEHTASGELCILGVGSAACSGVKQGMVVSIEETVAAITKAVEEAEGMSGVDIHSVVVGISGSHLRGLNNQNTIGVKGATVTEDDIANVLDAARAVDLSRDEEIVHVAAQRYVLDQQETIASPVGMAGDRLSVDAHVIVGAGTALQNLLRCIDGAGLSLDAIIPQPLASAHAVLSQEELELGVALVDIGGGTTDLAIYAGGSVCHTWVLPLGGTHVTRDISYGLSTPMKDAERIKIQHGSALVNQVDADAMIEVPSVGGRPPRDVPRLLLAEITEARMEEILDLVGQEIQRTGLRRHIGSGVVITGGGSLPPGTVELANLATGLIARRGVPVGLTGLTDLAATAQNATAVGLARMALTEVARAGAGQAGPKGLARLTSWVKEFF